jgi:hypothetical protein
LCLGVGEKDTALGCLTARRGGLVSSKHESHQDAPSKLTVVNNSSRVSTAPSHWYCAAPFSAEYRIEKAPRVFQMPYEAGEMLSFSAFKRVKTLREALECA